MNRLLFFVLVIFVSFDAAFGMTRAQLKKTLAMPKKQCMTKNGVTEDMVGGIESGKFVEDRKVMCYIACIYQTIQVMKNDRLDKDMIIKQVDILYPPELRAQTKAAVKQCLPIQEQYKDLCEGIFWSVKCLYEQDPASFVFP